MQKKTLLRSNTKSLPSNLSTFHLNLSLNIFYIPVFEIIGNCQSPGQNRVQCLRYVLLWLILACYMKFLVNLWIEYLKNAITQSSLAIQISVLERLVIVNLVKFKVLNLQKKCDTLSNYFLFFSLKVDLENQTLL